MAAKNWQPMTELDRRAAMAISSEFVTYPVASFDKRFARSMNYEARKTEAMITDAQRALLWSKVHRYRRQLRKEDRDLIPIATKIIDAKKNGEKKMEQRAMLGVDGNHAFALLGSNLQEGESEFEEFDPTKPHGKLDAAKAAFSRLKKRLGQPNLSYFLGSGLEE